MNSRFNPFAEWLSQPSAGILARFFTHVNHLPDNVAVITASKTLSYSALAQQATIIAQALQNKGVTLETPVGILLSPGTEQIISQLAILLAKGSCVPLDPAIPQDRLNDMLDDLNIQWTITSSPDQFPALHTMLLSFDELCHHHCSPDVRFNDIAPEHRTHVLFTSGTTGRPKAVEIEAKAILRLVVNTHYVTFTPADRVACIANPTFDASLFEIWGALLNGAVTVIIAKKEVLNIHAFAQELIRQKITIMFITASLFNLMATTTPRAFRLIHYLLVGGEALNPHTLKMILDSAPPQHLLNAYGPTECTTFALTHDIQPEDLTGGNVPIGKPIDHTCAVILDDNRQPVAAGEMGHLYLGGAGLARGYWHREALNQERFIQVTLPGYRAPQRLYKTGDLSVQRHDGVFIYHGRTDSQVKIRGHRIELEEIECQILKSGEVRATSALVVTKEHADPYLAAFIVPYRPEKFNLPVLERSLRHYLPEYMLPRLFIVDAIPLTPTGKTDKQQLLMALKANAVNIDRPEAISDTEYALLLIWRRILDKAEITPDDNFFQLGGSSLQAARLIIESERQFARHISVQTLYDAPTLRALAKIIDQNNADPQPDNVARWLQDAQLPPDIQPLAEQAPHGEPLQNATVLLTGVTGFLGAYLLHDLLIRPTIKQVCCLVRAADAVTARQRIENNLQQYGLWQPSFTPRIIPVSGDLSQPGLGLSQQCYTRLATGCDVIFHPGAYINYIEPYQAHRAANITGTLNILRLATQQKPKPLHYISTIAAFGPAGLLQKVGRIYEDDDLKPCLEGLKYDSGYSQSQWVVEQFIWEAHARGIPLAVYRPGFIMGDSVSGKGNPKDFVSRLIRGCIAIGACPHLPHQRKEFVPVDYVSAAILTIASDNHNLGRAYHLVPPRHEQSIDLAAFFALIGQSGYPLQTLPYPQWVAKLAADPHLDDNPLMPLLPMLSETVYQHQTRWEVYENMPAYDASNTQAALAAAHSTLTFTPMDNVQLRRHLDYWQSNGFLTAHNPPGLARQPAGGEHRQAAG